MPEATLKALADHGTISGSLPAHVEDELDRFTKSGIDTDVLGSRLQDEGVQIDLSASFNRLSVDIEYRRGFRCLNQNRPNLTPPPFSQRQG
jgi:hypothetical protein